MMKTQWDKTDQELSQELSKNNQSEIQKQTVFLMEILKEVGIAVKENKSVKVENIVREVIGKVAVERPDWIKELRIDLKPFEKKLDYIASAIIRKEVVREVGLKRPDWIKELIPKEIKFPEQKEAEKLIPVLKEVIKAIEKQEFPDEVSIKGEVEIKQPKWWKLPDFDKPILALASFIKKYFDKAVLKAEIQNEITIKNQVTEFTLKNPQKEVKITNLDKLEKNTELMTAQLKALGSTGSNGGGGIDTSNLATEETLQAVLAATGGSTYTYIQSATTALYKYYGYYSATGWQIKRKTLATGVWQKATGLGDYDTAWADRANKTYSY